MPWPMMPNPTNPICSSMNASVAGLYFIHLADVPLSVQRQHDQPLVTVHLFKYGMGEKVVVHWTDGLFGELQRAAADSLELFHQLRKGSPFTAWHHGRWTGNLEVAIR